MSEQRLPLPIAADHPAYAGHFPGRPILPGVVLLDAALQALAARHALPPTGQLRAAKFLSPVQPGEALTLHYTELNYTESPAGGFRFDIRASSKQSGERIVASGAIVYAQVDPA